MLRTALIALLAVMTAVCACAQEARGGSAAIDALLQTSLDSGHNNAGDAVSANVLADMKAADGRVIIPRGSIFSGSVVSATPKASGKEASIEISFDKLQFPDGTNFPVAATVQAVLVNVPKDKDAPTVGLGAPTRAMSGTNSGGVTSQIANGDRDKGAVIAENSENYQIGKSMPQNTAGVHGSKNVSLRTHDNATVISSTKAEVKIPSGSQLLLVVRNR